MVAVIGVQVEPVLPVGEVVGVRVRVGVAPVGVRVGVRVKVLVEMVPVDVLVRVLVRVNVQVGVFVELPPPPGRLSF